MLDNLKAMSALAGLMKSKEALKGAAERMKQRLSDLRAAGGSGGGAVRATMSGDMKLIGLHLDPPVCMALASNDAQSRQQVQQLIVEAVNNASDIAKAMAQREMAKEAEALGLGSMPGLENLLG
ncbi:MAG TPA: YbaB/EbfC family nucleoid-associated protein [Phycisphaerales bacterium]|nr:YbaB/EbfC family nucleoid-associated protein [Phycisphaerales bacterium]